MTRELFVGQLSVLALAESLHRAECECGDWRQHDPAGDARYFATAQNVWSAGWRPLDEQVERLARFLVESYGSYHDGAGNWWPNPGWNALDERARSAWIEEARDALTPVRAGSVNTP